MTSKRKVRREDFKRLTIEYLTSRGGEAEISDIVKYVQSNSRFGVERCSLGNILRSEPKLERRRSVNNSVYITSYVLAS